MKNKPWFNLVFMLLCTAFFTGILSGVYVYTRPLINVNNRLDEIRAHLNAFEVAIPAFGASVELEGFYEDQIKSETRNGLEMVVHVDDDGEALYYGFPFTGSGLWGAIEGILALSLDLETIVGIDFITQNETPGLGGRIEEEWFIEQFRGVTLFDDDTPLRYSAGGTEGQVDAITGATATSSAVVGMLNDKILEIRDTLGGDQ